MADVTVVDYGSSNLLNVVRALEHVGATLHVTEKAAEVVHADRIVLPGVGAFADGMAGLAERGLIDPLLAVARAERPFLGICLGMQMMLDRSEEFGNTPGLGLIPGEVVAIPAGRAEGGRRKIPHIGWNELRPPAAGPGWQGRFFAPVPPGCAVYFVHSFMAVPRDPADRLADCDYEGEAVCAAVQRDRLIGCQFHPEKSGEAGLDMLRRFLEL